MFVSQLSQVVLPTVQRLIPTYRTCNHWAEPVPERTVTGVKRRIDAIWQDSAKVAANSTSGGFDNFR
jgi:hypothetical protein